MDHLNWTPNKRVLATTKCQVLIAPIRSVNKSVKLLLVLRVELQNGNHHCIIFVELIEMNMWMTNRTPNELCMADGR